MKDLNTTITTDITFAGSVAADGYCTGQYFNNGFREYDNVVAHGSISVTLTTGTATRILERSRVRTPNGITCDEESGDCLDPVLGYVFWNTQDRHTCSKDNYEIIYTGSAVKVQANMSQSGRDHSFDAVIFTARQGEQVFSVPAVKRETRCGLDMYITEHAKYTIVEYVNDNPYFDVSPMSTEDLDIFLYVNAKFFHVLRDLRMELRAIVKRVTLDICEVERKQLQTLLTLANVSPLQFAYQYMDSPGYTAILAGEVIHIIKCVPVPALPREEEECTLEYPVTYRNESYYMTPRSHLLQKTSTPLSCALSLLPEYHFFTNWYTVRRGSSPVHPPKILIPHRGNEWLGRDFSDVFSSGIYTRKQLDEIRHQIMSPQERKSITERLAGNLNHEAYVGKTLDISTLINDSMIKSRVQAWWEETMGWFWWVGRLGSSLFSFYILYQLTSKLISTTFRVHALHEAFGCSFKLLAAIFSGITSFLLHNLYVKTTSTIDPECAKPDVLRTSNRPVLDGRHGASAPPIPLAKKSIRPDFEVFEPMITPST